MNGNIEQLHPLTKTQSDFAAKNYDMVFDYLAARNLNADDYHDVVILSYLCAVQQYDECPEQCTEGFEALAGDFMQGAIYQYQMMEQQRNRVFRHVYAS